MEKQTDSILLKTFSDNKQMDLLSTYNKSYSRTHHKWITIDYTWEIDNLWVLHKFLTNLTSEPFPKTAEYKIQMTISPLNEGLSKYILRFFVCTKKTFSGICKIWLAGPKGEKLINSISGTILNMSLLCEIVAFENLHEDKFTIHFIFNIFENFVIDTIHVNPLLLPAASSRNLISKNSKCLSDDASISIEGNKSIKFIINNEIYIIPRDLLHATNSLYFKKNTKETIIIINKPDAVKEMLLFIKAGLMPECIKSYSENQLSDLLVIAHKYDVQDLCLICEEHLLQNITIDNAVKFLWLAFSCKAKYLEQQIAHFIKFHLEILHTKEFQNALPQEYKIKIIELIKEIKVHRILKYIEY